ncbi:MAG TPA: DUF4476 domain-containing protein [Myxococcales bacterium]|jgi:hypothetical protein
MVRAALSCFVLLLSTAALAQDVNVRVGGMGMSMGVHVNDQGAAAAAAPIPAESYRLEFENNAEGATVMKVVSPEGARVDVWNGKQMVHQDDIPTSFAAAPDTFYRFVIRLPDGRVWEKKLSAKRRSTGTLALLVPAVQAQVVVVEQEREERHHRHHEDDRGPAPMGPMPMPEPDFSSLKSAIAGEAFEDGKLSVLGTAAGATYFTVGQVGQLVDLFTFSDGKVKVVSLTQPRILDLQNAFQLYGHFTFDADKKKVKRILGQ